MWINPSKDDAKSRDGVVAWSLRRSLLEKFARVSCHSATACPLDNLGAVHSGSAAAYRRWGSNDDAIILATVA